MRWLIGSLKSVDGFSDKRTNTSQKLRISPFFPNFQATFHLFGQGPNKFNGELCKLDETISIDISIDKTIKSGDNLNIKVSILSQVDQKVRYIGGLYSCACIDKTTTKKKNLIVRYTDEIELKSGDVQTMMLSCSSFEYFNKLEYGNALKFKFLLGTEKKPGSDTGVDALAIKEHGFVLDNPEIMQIFADKKLVKGVEFRVRVRIKNPFKVVLTKCKIEVEGVHMNCFSESVRNIGIGKSVDVVCRMVARKPGKKTLLIDLDTEQVQDVKGFYQILILDE